MPRGGPELFRVLLIAVIGLLLAVNVFMLIGGNFLSLIAIGLQAPLLVALTTRSRRQVGLTRVWATLIMIVGAAGLVGACSNVVLLSLKSTDTDYSQLGVGHLAVSICALAFGSFVFKKSKSYLRPLSSSEPTSGAKVHPAPNHALQPTAGDDRGVEPLVTQPAAADSDRYAFTDVGQRSG